MNISPKPEDIILQIETGHPLIQKDQNPDRFWLLLLYRRINVEIKNYIERLGFSKSMNVMHNLHLQIHPLAVIKMIIA